MSANPLLTWEYLLGERLLRFVLNADSGDLGALTDDQEGVLLLLDSGEAFRGEPDPRLPYVLGVARDGQFPRAWQFRMQCGAELPAPRGPDDLTRRLSEIARDVFCILLSPPDLSVSAGPGRSVQASDPLITLIHAVEAHPLSRDLAHDMQGEADSWGDLRIETVTGIDHINVPTPTAVLGAGAERWRHQTSTDASAFMSEATGCMVDLRKLVAGETVAVPAVIGLRGIQVPESHAYDLPFGQLRPATEDESHFTPFRHLSSAVSSGVDSVLATTIECRAVEVSSCDAEFTGASQRHLANLARAIALGSAIARRTDGDRQTAAAIEWITDATPTQGSGTFRPRPVGETWVEGATYNEEQIAVLSDWVERILAADLSHVGIAIERLLRACGEQEWGEALIDAVIAWENLLGTRTETTYRVTAALAVLLEDDRELRIVRRKELGKIYDARSELVHGDSFGAAPEMRDRAIQVGLESLARLMRDRPSLLSLSKSSRRADRLLLGVDDPEENDQQET